MKRGARSTHIPAGSPGLVAAGGGGAGAGAAGAGSCPHGDGACGGARGTVTVITLTTQFAFPAARATPERPAHRSSHSGCRRRCSGCTGSGPGVRSHDRRPMTMTKTPPTPPLSPPFSLARAPPAVNAACVVHRSMRARAPAVPSHSRRCWARAVAGGRLRVCVCVCVRPHLTRHMHFPRPPARSPFSGRPDSRI